MKLLAAILLSLTVAPAAHAAEPARASEFRDGVSVEWLYQQDIEAPYFTNWFGRVEGKNGPWRDIYFETNEKFVSKGIMRLNCTNSAADITITSYGWEKFGDESNRTVMRVAKADQRKWAAGTLDALRGEDPPFAVYTAAKRKFCGRAGR